jgi:hypothetical protein
MTVTGETMVQQEECTAFTNPDRFSLEVVNDRPKNETGL